MKKKTKIKSNFYHRVAIKKLQANQDFKTGKDADIKVQSQRQTMQTDEVVCKGKEGGEKQRMSRRDSHTYNMDGQCAYLTYL